MSTAGDRSPEPDGSSSSSRVSTVPSLNQEEPEWNAGYNDWDPNHAVGDTSPPKESSTSTSSNNLNVGSTLSIDDFVSAREYPISEKMEPSMSTVHKVALIFVACLAQLLNLGGMNQTVASVMPLADAFHIHDYGTLSWWSAAYSMTVGTFILPAGRLGDMYGHKKMFLVGWIWFATWSCITGFSHNWSGIIFFSIARAFQGIGPALLIPNAIALLGIHFPVGTQRNIAFSCFGAAGPTGAAIGAAMTAVITDLGWWPWCFWTLAIVCTVACFLTVLIVPGKACETPKQAGHLAFDYWGCLTGVSGLVLLNFALNQAPLDSWTTWYIILTAALGVVFLVLFVLVEVKLTEYPLIPIKELDYQAYFALGCIAAGWGSHGIWAYYLYLFLEQVKRHSALLTSAETSPVAVTGILFALSTPWLVKRFGVSIVMLIAMTIFLAGSLLLALLPLNQTYWLQTFISIIVMPGAMNLSFPAATILISSALPKEKQGIAASLVSTMVNYCISCGLGFAGTVHKHFYLRQIAKIPDLINHPGDPPPLLTFSTPELQRARLESFRGPWWFATGLSGLGILIAAAFILWTRKKNGT